MQLIRFAKTASRGGLHGTDMVPQTANSTWATIICSLYSCLGICREIEGGEVDVASWLLMLRMLCVIVAIRAQKRRKRRKCAGPTPP